MTIKHTAGGTRYEQHGEAREWGPGTRESQRMVGALCAGCGQGSSSKLGKVTQRDLGSADKWHSRCYRASQATARFNRNQQAIRDYVNRPH